MTAPVQVDLPITQQARPNNEHSQNERSHNERSHNERPAVPGWLAVAASLTDLAFETDCAGRFTAFGPGKALGHATLRLLGTPVAALLSPAEPDDGEAAQFNNLFTTICTECVGWQGNVRLARADGTTTSYRLALAPRLSGGTVIGSYGLLLEIEAAAAAPRGISVIAESPLLDGETGLWSASVFADELARRFDRLDVEERPGTLLYLGFSRASATGRSPAAIHLAAEMKDIVRPTDLLGRVGVTIIALWCDGMDHLTGAERATRLCRQLPAMLPDNLPITAGLVTRWPMSGDDPQTVMARAGAALDLADQGLEAGGGTWRVWQAE